MSDVPALSPAPPGDGLGELDASPLTAAMRPRWGRQRVIVAGVTLGGRPFAASRPIERVLKRTVDVVVAATLLVLMVPLMLLIALAIRLDSPGRVLFRQTRIGRDGREFRLLKFRTMVADAEKLRTALVERSRDAHWLHLDRDPRITTVGRLLRVSSLDELPQLWNVLRGQMSLVGPRPLIACEHEHVHDWARVRMQVPPGVTGLWQVAGRTTVPFDGMLALDRLYATHWSLWTDLAILCRTPWVVITRKGAN